jgi:hypothetical protein
VHGRVENPNWSELKLSRPVERLLDDKIVTLPSRD